MLVKHIENSDFFKRNFSEVSNSDDLLLFMMWGYLTNDNICGQEVDGVEFDTPAFYKSGVQYIEGPLTERFGADNVSRVLSEFMTTIKNKPDTSKNTAGGRSRQLYNPLSDLYSILWIWSEKNK